jgi:ABC-type nitrate/sulfonate/bicarbonate transport system substrate-binding protein
VKEHSERSPRAVALTNARRPSGRNVAEDSPFEAKLKALKGLTFGVSTPGSLTYNMGLYYILRAGLKP